MHISKRSLSELHRSFRPYQRRAPLTELRDRSAGKIRTYSHLIQSQTACQLAYRREVPRRIELRLIRGTNPVVRHLTIGTKNGIEGRAAPHTATLSMRSKQLLARSNTAYEPLLSCTGGEIRTLVVGVLEALAFQSATPVFFQYARKDLNLQLSD